MRHTHSYLVSVKDWVLEIVDTHRDFGDQSIARIMGLFVASCVQPRVFDAYAFTEFSADPGCLTQSSADAIDEVLFLVAELIGVALWKLTGTDGQLPRCERRGLSLPGGNGGAD